jgi:integrase
MATVRSRTRSDGSVRYQVRWIVGGGRATGRTQASETFVDSGEAERFAAAVEAAGNDWPEGWAKGRGYLDPTGRAHRGVTFAGVATDFFQLQETRCQLGRLKPYTLHRYRREYELHLAEYFGARSFAGLTYRDVESWMSQNVQAGAKPKSMRNRHALLYMIMRHGQARMTLRGDNPCEISELPESTDDVRQLRFFTHDEWALLRSCLKSDVQLMVDVALMTGMRWGELSALRVGDVTWNPVGDAVVHVVRSWSKRAPNDPSSIRWAEHENASWKLGPPKNRRMRFVMLTDHIADAVRRHVDGLDASEYVFTTRRGNPWRYPDFYSDRWKPALAVARERGLRKHGTIHMLRHTTVVWCLSEGVSLHKVSEMLGHSSIKITYDTYGGVLNGFDDEGSRSLAKGILRVAEGTAASPSQTEVDHRPIRPGPRGGHRSRYGDAKVGDVRERR